jgi:hypothetical protein
MTIMLYNQLFSHEIRGENNFDLLMSFCEVRYQLLFRIIALSIWFDLFGKNIISMSFVLKIHILLLGFVFLISDFE